MSPLTLRTGTYPSSGWLPFMAFVDAARDLLAGQAGFYHCGTCFSSGFPGVSRGSEQVVWQFPVRSAVGLMDSGLVSLDYVRLYNEALLAQVKLQPDA